jgi:hypothetical protein
MLTLADPNGPVAEIPDHEGPLWNLATLVRHAIRELGRCNGCDSGFALARPVQHGN